MAISLGILTQHFQTNPHLQRFPRLEVDNFERTRQEVTEEGVGQCCWIFMLCKGTVLATLW